MKFIYKILLLGSLTVHSVAFASTALSSQTNKNLLSVQNNEINATLDQNSLECSRTDKVDPNGNPSSLGGAAAKILANKVKQIQTPINFDQTFSTAKQGGCFDVLHDIPDLSISIPSLSQITTSIASSLQKYATQKVCSAVNDTLENAVGGLRDKLNQLSNSGQLDLSGRVNKSISQKAYSVDPSIANDLNKNSSQNSSYTFSW